MLQQKQELLASTDLVYSPDIANQQPQQQEKESLAGPDQNTKIDHRITGDYPYYDITKLQNIKPESLESLDDRLYGEHDFVIYPAEKNGGFVDVKLGSLFFEFKPEVRLFTISYINKNKHDEWKENINFEKYANFIEFRDICPLMHPNMESLKHDYNYNLLNNDQSATIMTLANKIKTETQNIINNNKTDPESLSELKKAIEYFNDADFINMPDAEYFFESLPDQKKFLKYFNSLNPDNSYQKMFENVVLERIKKSEIADKLHLVKLIKQEGGICSEDKIQLSKVIKAGVMDALENPQNNLSIIEESIKLIEESLLLKSAKDVFITNDKNLRGNIGDYSYYDITKLQYINPKALSYHMYGEDDFVIHPEQNRDFVQVKLGSLFFEFKPEDEEFKIYRIDKNERSTKSIATNTNDLSISFKKYGKFIELGDICPLKYPRMNPLDRNDNYHKLFDDDQNVAKMVLAHKIKIEIQKIIDNNETDYESFAELAEAIKHLHNSKCDISDAEAFFESLPDQKKFLQQFNTLNTDNGYQKMFEKVVLWKINNSGVAYKHIAGNKIKLRDIIKAGITEALKSPQNNLSLIEESIKLIKKSLLPVEHTAVYIDLEDDDIGL